MKYPILATLSVALLAGCGGGGGGGTTGSSDVSAPDTGTSDTTVTPVSVAPGAPIPQDASPPFILDGSSVKTTVAAGGGLGLFSGTQPATLVTSTDDAAAGTLTRSFTSDGTTIDVNDIQATSGSGDPNTNRFEFVIFGVWAESNGADGNPTVGDDVFLGAFGTPTPVADRPADTATYRGVSIGVSDIGGTSAITNSNVGVQVTNGFRDVIFESRDTTINSQARSELDFVATGSVNDNGFQAGVDDMSVTGDFYGPAAEETTGVFEGVRGGANYGGAFGAFR